MAVTPSDFGQMLIVGGARCLKVHLGEKGRRRVHLATYSGPL